MKRKSKILKEAWCNELNRIVTAEEVWYLLFGDHRVKEELTFKCAYAKCPAKMIKKDFKSYASSWYASFKLYPNEQHLDTCPYHRKVKRKKPKERLPTLSSFG